MKISVAGMGYVGLSNSLLLAQKNTVVAYDLDKIKVDMLNKKKSYLKEEKIIDYLANKKLDFNATTNKSKAFSDSSFVIIATPTDYDPETNFFDTRSIEAVITEVLHYNPKANIIIKSTIPIGYTSKVKKVFNNKNIIFSPEFLREGNALEDCLYPSRIVVGDKTNKAIEFANLLKQAAIKKNIPILYTSSKEAEAIKLFSNTYLAMRVSYFNELDTFAEINNLNTKDIIDGVCLDERIGLHYNNPSFGYGGYCLPKDTKQLLSNFKDIPSNLIQAIVDTNNTRKNFIAESIMKSNPKVIGIHRLIMKSDSDNFRSSAIMDVIKKINKKSIEIVIYEPLISEDFYNNLRVINNLDEFKRISDVIVTNRISDELLDVKDKLYTRDIFNNDF